MGEFKICCFSALRTGQSTLISRFHLKSFPLFVPEFDVVDSYRKQITVDECPCLLDILDAVQQDEYNALIEIYKRKADGFLFSFSLTDRDSLAYAEKMIESICNTRNVTDFPMILVATKADLKDEYKVSIEEGQTLANKYEIPFYVTSAKENLNVNEVFIGLTRKMVAYRQKHPIDTNENSRKGKCIVM